MHAINVIDGPTFSAKDQQTILDAAISAGITLPYSCKTGRCSSCKCRILKGDTTAHFAETGLTALEKAEGWVLSCVRAPVGNIEIEADVIEGEAPPAARTFPCRVNELNLLAPDVLQVKLRLPPTADFQFIPGQYIDVIGPNGIRRSYSLANSDFSEKLLELHIRNVPGGVLSEYWFNQAKQNDLLRINGPLGTFFLRDLKDLDLVFLATGTGIAPVKSMLGSLANLSKDKQPRSIHVLWGGRKEQDIYCSISCNPELTFTYIPVLSRASEEWAGARGYVQQVLLGNLRDLSNAAVYACGSSEMIQGSKKLLQEAGLPVKRFYSDAFVSSESN